MDQTGTPLGAFTGSDLACFSSSCADTLFDLATFISSSTIGSIVLTDDGAAFEYAFPGGAVPVSATPLPAAFPLFATGIGGLGLFGWRRKRKADRRSQPQTI